MAVHLSHPRLCLMLIVIGLGFSSSALAGWSNLWTLGTADGQPYEFGWQSYVGNTTPNANSATTHDEDYFFPGTYATPVGIVTTQEALGNFESTFDIWDSSTRIHFMLSGAQASMTAQFRLHINAIWGGDSGGKDFGTHQFRVRLNGTDVGTATLTYPKTMIFTFNAAPAAIAGANVLELSRTGGSTGGLFSMDSLGLDSNPTALTDGDGDGLPQAWEQSNGLSDALASDAVLDSDHDGSTNAQEFARGTNAQRSDTDGDTVLDGAENTTNPLLADTDGDTLTDGEEVIAGTYPLAIDSDGDGAPDAWELRVGTSATSSSSAPAAFGSAIGVHFSSEVAPTSVLTPLAVAGLVPQMNWNNTIILRQWEPSAIAGTTANIASPTAGVLKNSAGVATTAQVSWSADATWAAGNSGSSTQTLLNSALWTNGDSTQATVSFTDVPFTSYDVIVYYGSTYDGAEGEITCTPSVSRESRFLTQSAAPQSAVTELLYPSTPPYAGTFYRRRGNAVRFHVTGSSACTIKLYRSAWHEAGIHAVQIVDSNADTDGDGMPDWYEVTHQLNAAANDAATDADGDTVNNLAEFNASTNPRKADTDGDGLSDSAEATAGTNPLHADTDGDTLSDGVEIALKPSPTNPLLIDTDADGKNDNVELAQFTDPIVGNGPSDRMPNVTGVGAKTFDWTLYLQFIWDHERGFFTDGEWNDSQLAWIMVRNRQTNVDAMVLSLRMTMGKMTAMFHSNHGGAFSHPDDDFSDIWHSDWDSPPADLRAALGFSGYGHSDVSSRLRMRVAGTSTGSASDWNITFSIYNLDTNQTVMTQTFNNCTLEAGAHAGTTIWTDSADNANQLHNDVHSGIRLHYLASAASPSIDSTSAMAAVLDSDNDGMPNVWETTYSFNTANATDGLLDADGDTLSNVREYELGTHPRNPDTDNDGVKDGIEVSARSDPLLPGSRPPHWTGLPPGIVGEDMNGNGMSDAFELWLGRFDLAGTADSDGDGKTNAEEAIAGTDPLNAASTLWLGEFRSGNDLTIRWPRLLNKTHQLLQSTDLTAWSVYPSSPVTVGNEFRVTIPSPFATPRKFYQASVADLDTDGDGVSDWTEANVMGSSITTANSLGSSIQQDTNDDDVIDTTVSGDYASLVERLHGGSSTGGFVGGGTAIGVSAAQASRFLMQASFGSTSEDIDRVQQLGYAAWITYQISKQPTLHSTYAKAITADLFGPQADLSYNYGDDKTFLFGNNISTAFARAAVGGQDQLRQRVAFALSQILVTSRRDANLENQVLGMTDYYDIFVRHAFGNYFDILMEVTMHPCMGRYLSHVGNQKADPTINRYPDENYAREVMQLFTIGLWQLHPNGTRQVNGQGQNIPTYSNTEITQLARVLTGLWFGQHPWGQGGWASNDYATPMSLHPDRHDFGTKTLLGGYIIPSREPTADAAMQDIRDAIRHLFNHPNTGPFVCKQLIQFLVTDNPSPAYVQRVATVFADNGSGTRGDLGAVIRSILLDTEARSPATAVHDSSFGRLKEPVIRTMAMARAFGMKEVPNLLWWNWSEFYDAARQEPGYSPSVFNFYRPEYKAPGLLTANQKNGPVFQITDSFSSIAFPNKLWEMVNQGFTVWNRYQFPLRYSREVALASTPEKLVDHMNLLFCAGQMSLGSRTIILNAINTIPATDADTRARMAAYLTLVCPEGAVLK